MKNEIIHEGYKIEFGYYPEHVDFRISKINYDSFTVGWIYYDGSNAMEIDFTENVDFGELKIIHQLFELVQSTASEYFRVQKELAS